MCRRSSQIVSLVIALLCGGVTRGASPVVVPSLPPSDFADTEIVTNVPFSAGGAHDREFILSIALAASASNDVEVALGVDADANGMLDRTMAGRMSRNARRSTGTWRRSVLRIADPCLRSGNGGR